MEIYSKQDTKRKLSGLNLTDEFPYEDIDKIQKRYSNSILALKMID